MGARPVDSSKAADVFDREAARYDAWFDASDGRVLFQSEVDAVRLLLKDLPGPLLEVGVGTGRFAEALRMSFGIDPALGTLKIARRRGIRVAQARGEALPFLDRSFGGVLLIVILCFAEPRLLLQEARRVLRPDGALIIADILRDSAWGRWYLEQKLAGHPFYRHATFFTLSELQGFLTDAGFAPARFASTITQQPGAALVAEGAYEGVKEGASFVCLLAKVA
jgi:ubiquinone/menaquinone biosynthesis C-methylase UbiE